MQDAEWMPKREVFQMECSSGFESRRRGGDQQVKSAERQADELTEGAQAGYSHDDRYFR
jgi:hypothetical protein